MAISLFHHHDPSKMYVKISPPDHTVSTGGDYAEDFGLESEEHTEGGLGFTEEESDNSSSGFYGLNDSSPERAGGPDRTPGRPADAQNHPRRRRKLRLCCNKVKLSPCSASIYHAEIM